MIDVAITVADSRWFSCAFDNAFIERLIETALKNHLNQNKDYEVSVLLTHDFQIRELNSEWRGKDKATNVLSFPGDSPHEDSTDRDDKSDKENLPFEKAPDWSQTPDGSQAPIVLGDICLAYETVATEATDCNLSMQDRMAHLIVHGLLHLLGFDHEDDQSANNMEAEEDRILDIFNIKANRNSN